MLTHSLFYDFITQNGLRTYGKDNSSTRDIICIEFNYGTRSYEEDIKHMDNLIKETMIDNKLSDDKKKDRIFKLTELKENSIQNKERYCKKNADDIRILFYTEGVTIHYETKNKKGKIIYSEDIHYKMLYRTPGKAKKGSCMFINEKLYDSAREFLYMGIELPYENSPIVEIGAYSSLITSTIVGKVHIDPSEILVVKDVDSFFETNVVSIETDDDKHCHAYNKSNYKLKNTLFDGQALIDSSIFPDWGNGYILLRQHFCKMAAFNTNIQLFMKDYFKDDYETATVKDMWGNDINVKNIKLVTTDNALKWLKFGVSYEYWSEWVRKNGSMFGIVKTAHKSKLGDVQRMSYQMVNALSMDIMPEVTKCSMDYIEKLKTDDDVFLDYLRDNQNFSNDYEVLVALCEQDRDFLRSSYFRDRKKTIIKSYVLNFKNGRTIQNADNLTIVGSPYAMLLHSVGENPKSDPTFIIEKGTIQCFTNRFENNEYLAEFRSPFNSKNNMGYLHNIRHEYLDKYFNLGNQCVAINMNGTDFQDRNNGSDQDSDSIYTTNHSYIVDYAKYCYQQFPTIVNNIPMEKNSYTNEIINYAKIDNGLSAAQLAIGESSNLAQVCLTYTYNFNDQKYIDYVCILSVLAQVAIDNAKRRFDINLVEEIKNIKSDMNIKENKYPNFWSIIRKDFNKDRLNTFLKCPMNYIYDLDIVKFKSDESTLPMSNFFVNYELENHRRKSKKVEELIEKYSLEILNNNIEPSDEYDDYLLLRDDFDDLISEIRRIYISKSYLGLMSWLINRAFVISPGIKGKLNTYDNSIIKNNKALLLKVLYDINPTQLLKIFAKNIEKVDNKKKAV